MVDKHFTVDFPSPRMDRAESHRPMKDSLTAEKLANVIEELKNKSPFTTIEDLRPPVESHKLVVNHRTYADPFPKEEIVEKPLIDEASMAYLKRRLNERVQEQFEAALLGGDVERTFRDRLYELETAYDAGHIDSQKFYDLLLGLAELHDKKQADYGRDNDPFANVRRAFNLGINPSLGVILRMGDKFGRLESFALTGELQNESVEDSLRDIAVYALIALVLLGNGE